MSKDWWGKLKDDAAWSERIARWMDRNIGAIFMVLVILVLWLLFGSTLRGQTTQRSDDYSKEFITPRSHITVSPLPVPDIDATVVRACVTQESESLLIVVFVDSMPIRIEMPPIGGSCFQTVLSMHWNDIQFAHVMPWEEE